MKDSGVPCCILALSQTTELNIVAFDFVYIGVPKFCP